MTFCLLAEIQSEWPNIKKNNWFDGGCLTRMRQTMQIPARRICCCDRNIHIHTEYRNPVEEKGRHGHSLSERGRERVQERESRPLPGQAFIAFLGTLHRRWSSFTMHRFTVGDYLLQTTKDRMLLITSKRRMLQIKGESG